MISPFDDLFVLIEKLGDDERRVLTETARRLAMGRKHYGDLDLDGDSREWTKEALEEALDMSNYLAMALAKLRRK